MKVVFVIVNTEIVDVSDGGDVKRPYCVVGD